MFRSTKAVSAVKRCASTFASPRRPNSSPYPPSGVQSGSLQLYFVPLFFANETIECDWLPRYHEPSRGL
jgi:hypothetical protein